ncbi:MAG: hypothetical protein ACR2PL_02295 [Dehalococcoidia bacterium]
MVSGPLNPPVTGTITLARFTLQRVSPAGGLQSRALSADSSSPDLALSAAGATDSNGHAVAPATDSGTAQPVALGDANADGAVNAVDALCVLRSVVGLAETPVCPAIPMSGPSPANVKSGGGAVNAVDALCVLRNVARLSSTPACPPIPTSSSGTQAASASVGQR